MDFVSDFYINENGYLDPDVRDVDIDFGNTYLYHDNKIVAFFMHQFLYFGILMVQNSVYFLGDFIFNHIGGDILDKAFNDYWTFIHLPSPFPG